MRVSRLKNNDWTFGQSKANYITNSEAIRQNVKTRLRSFANDWFLDVKANIDWLNILGSRNNKETIRAEVVRVVLATIGVLSLDKFELSVAKRDATITIKFTDIFKKSSEITVEV